MVILDYAVDYVVPFVLVLSALVFVHELGHYAIARRYGVRVEVFSIGFGPELFGFTDRFETRWKFSAIPLGGYVKMFGEADLAGETPAAPLSLHEQKVSFQHKTCGQRSAIVAAGPLANFAFALLLLGGLFGIVGAPRPLAAVGGVQDDSAAAAAGMRQGDLIVSIDGQAVKWFDDVRTIVRDQPGTALAFTLSREGHEVVVTATPTRSVSTDPDSAGRETGVLGIRADLAQVGYERLPPLAAAWAAAERCYGLTVQILQALWQIVSGARGADELGGPLRIAQLSGQMAENGVVNLVFFMAALSINLGLINFLPIPMLDGGHLAFYAVEAIRGRPVDKRVQEYGFRFGLIFVLLLMIFATWNDLLSLNVFGFVE